MFPKTVSFPSTVFSANLTFLQYFGLLAAIPRQWKDLFNVQGSQETPTSQLTIDKLN